MISRAMYTRLQQLLRINAQSDTARLQRLLLMNGQSDKPLLPTLQQLHDTIATDAVMPS